MDEAKPIIYRVEVKFKRPGDHIKRLVADLGITPKGAAEIVPDSWGTRKTLEIWFLDFDRTTLSLHIQKAHYRQNKTYVRDLEDCLAELRDLDYVSEVTGDSDD